MRVRTAIAVMCRVPRAGEGKTRLAGAVPAEVLVALQAAMLADTAAVLETVAADARYLFVAPTAGEDARATCLALTPHVPAGWNVRVQEGSDLGGRIEHVFASLFAGGPGRALVTGSDAPILPVHTLDLAGVDEDEALLVPADDGGYAALVLGRLEPSLFRAMTWSTSTVAAETRRRARLAGLRVRDLPSTFDVDEPADLARLRQTLEGRAELAPRTARVLGLGTGRTRG